MYRSWWCLWNPFLFLRVLQSLQIFQHSGHQNDGLFHLYCWRLRGSQAGTGSALLLGGQNGTSGGGRATRTFRRHPFRFLRLLGERHYILLYYIFLGICLWYGLHGGLGIGVPAWILQLCLPIDGRVGVLLNRLQVVDVNLQEVSSIKRILRKFSGQRRIMELP